MLPCAAAPWRNETPSTAESLGNSSYPLRREQLLLGIHTSNDSSTLHVLASSGDDYLRSAISIYDNAKHLLDAPNMMGDTPLHCAARACNFKMLSGLISLAKGEDSDHQHSRVKQILRKQNNCGETVLHEVVRSACEAMVCELLEADSELARVPTGGISPLYLAISLGHVQIVSLLHSLDNELSHSGQDGQISLHAAVLHGKEMTEMILKWSGPLLTMAADNSGSTPLHFAASVDGLSVETARSLMFGSHRFTNRFHGKHGACTTRLLLEANVSLALIRDNKGALPIHIASSVGDLRVVEALVKECPECATMCDNKGRTLLHVAVEKKRRIIVDFICSDPRLARVMNMQDNDGNTALHLAIHVGSLRIFHSLIKNRKVNLNLANSKGDTPLDYSWSRRPAEINYRLDPRARIHQLLVFANAKIGNRRWDHFHEQRVPKLNEAEESKKLTQAAQIVGISSVLVATVTFAAAFTVPGGYRADDHVHGGTPTLAGSYAFNGFIISNTLAFCCSVLATFSLIYSGLTWMGLYTRFRYFVVSVAFLRSSSRSLAVAFSLGVYVALAPVALGIVIATIAITLLALLMYENRDIIQILTDARVLQARMGFPVLKQFRWILLSKILSSIWCYIVIFSLAVLRGNRQ